jgi:hypothetical protein
MLFILLIEQERPTRRLASSTGNAERESRLLNQLNQAVIDLEVGAPAKSKQFSLTDHWADDLGRLYAH